MVAYSINNYKLDFIDEEFLSYQEKEIKPDLTFFYKLISKYSLGLESTVFVDDRLENILAAKKAGIISIHNISNMETINKLDSFLVKG